MNKNNLKGSIILILASLIWGLAFIVQSFASKIISTFIFNGLRSLIGALAIFTFLFVKSKITNQPIFERDAAYKKNAVIGGIICGIFLCAAVNFQQAGITVYPEGAAAEARAGFLTALYVIMVPFASVIIGKRVTLPVWLGVIIAALGVYFLCLTEGFKNIYLGDILMILCAVTFTGHIMFIDYFGAKVGGPQLSCIQFIVCGVLSVILSFAFGEKTTFSTVKDALPQIIYMGILSSGVAYTLQIVGQKYAEPAIASISMSFEGVFATLGALFIMGSVPTLRETIGCVLVFIATVLAQLPPPKRSKKWIEKQEKN